MIFLGVSKCLKLTIRKPSREQCGHLPPCVLSKKKGIFTSAHSRCLVCNQWVAVEPRPGEDHCCWSVAEKAVTHTGTIPRASVPMRGHRK